MSALKYMFAGLIFFAATASTGDRAIADECDEKPTTVDIMECKKRFTSSWEAVIETAYRKALKSTTGEANKLWKESQTLWLRYRDVNCRLAGMGEGSITTIYAAECRLRMTKQRAAELGAEDH